MKKLNVTEVGTTKSVALRQIALVAVFLLTLVLGFIAQVYCFCGEDDWFARAGAVVVGMVVAVQSLDANFGWFSGFRQVNLAPHFATYRPKTRFAILEAASAILATIVWGFGDLATTTCRGMN